jgi:hypothetical protein
MKRRALRVLGVVCLCIGLVGLFCGTPILMICLITQGEATIEKSRELLASGAIDTEAMNRLLKSKGIDLELVAGTDSIGNPRGYFMALSRDYLRHHDPVWDRLLLVAWATMSLMCTVSALLYLRSTGSPHPAPARLQQSSAAGPA